DLFWRTECTSTYTLNDSSAYGYKGISQFSSSANVSITKFIKKIGLYGSEAGNRYMYRISSPATNALLGIKYIISKNGQQHADETFLEYYGNSETSYLYKNKYSLPLGYMMNEDILRLGNDILDTSDYDIPFEYQNAIFKYATGINEDLYTPQPVAVADHKGVYVTKNSYGNYTYNINPDEKASAEMKFEYTVPENSMLYGYVSNSFDKVAVKQDSRTIDSNIDVSDYPIMFPMGSCEAGQNVRLEIDMNNDKANGSAKIMVYALNKDIFEQMYQKLADEPFVITDFSDTKITGTVNALNDGIMYLSIPYEKGWSVYVDGEKQELLEIMDAVSGVRVSAGQHEIKLRYIPEGFIAGTSCTVISLVLFIMLAVLDFRKKKNIPESETVSEEIPESADEAENYEKS
ncbi:MAG: YfhO family protein, partial [Ruminococcus sp.]